MNKTDQLFENEENFCWHVPLREKWIKNRAWGFKKYLYLEAAI